MGVGSRQNLKITLRNDFGSFNFEGLAGWANLGTKLLTLSKNCQKLARLRVEKSGQFRFSVVAKTGDRSRMGIADVIGVNPLGIKENRAYFDVIPLTFAIEKR